MKIISVKILKEFWQKHPDSEQHLKAWVDEAKHANWLQPADIKSKYRHANVLKNKPVVFNIKGNQYRLIVAIAYRFGAIYIKFIGTHLQYDAINAETIALE
jgi:mRNA interferase HigB